MLPFRKKDRSTDKTRVLVIDDETAFTRMVKLNLEATGRYEVGIVNESPQAVATATEFAPDIILLDIIMPQADGGDVAHDLRTRPATKQIPIVFVSAMVSQKETHRGFYESGGEHFLAKPVDTATLTGAIETVLSQPT